jgi:hypothetical protein
MPNMKKVNITLSPNQMGVTTDYCYTNVRWNNHQPKISIEDQKPICRLGGLPLERIYLSPKLGSETTTNNIKLIDSTNKLSPAFRSHLKETDQFIEKLSEKEMNAIAHQNSPHSLLEAGTQLISGSWLDLINPFKWYSTIKDYFNADDLGYHILDAGKEYAGFKDEVKHIVLDYYSGFRYYSENCREFPEKQPAATFEDAPVYNFEIEVDMSYMENCLAKKASDMPVLVHTDL